MAWNGTSEPPRAAMMILPACSVLIRHIMSTRGCLGGQRLRADQVRAEGSSCTEIPYDFHPMYSTSSPQTRVPWAAHSYNIAFDEEIGHFDYCTRVTIPTGTCNGGLEGAPGDQEPTDADDVACFPASASLLVQVSGCNGTNAPGFDGTSYLNDWPDENTSLHPTPELRAGPPHVSGACADHWRRLGWPARPRRCLDTAKGGSWP